MTSRALFLKEKFGTFEVGATALPTPGPGEVLIKEHSVPLNPADWKIQAYGVLVSDYPAILGRDGAGEVEAVGEGVTQFSKGDKVFHPGGLTDNHYTTFQEYVVAPADVVARLPDNITFDQAASLPLGIGTSTVPLYSPFPAGVGLQPPWDGGRGQYAGQTILVFGGSTSIGQYTIQFAKLSGFSPIITTASLRNTDLLKSLGATHVIDRNSSSIASDITNITTQQISLIYDAVGEADTQQLGYDILVGGGHLITVLPSSIQQVPGSTKKVLTAFGNVQVPNNRAIGRALAQVLPGLLASGDIVPNEVEVIPGGLGGIPAGLERLKNNLVSAKKLIARPGETA